MTKEEADLFRAVEKQEYALSLCEPDSFYEITCTYNLGTGAYLLYEVTRNLEDLNRAIALLERAIELLEPEERASSGYRPNLAMMLRARFDRTEDFADLERAKQLERQS
jgi:tetratricopeptide (TPR) repeat protein